MYRKNSDFLILQETHSDEKCERMWESEWGGDILFCHGTSKSRGIAICMPKGRKKMLKHIITSEDGRLIIFDYKDSDKIVTIVAIYAPNVDTPQYFRQISLYLKERSEHKIIVGDFNLTIDVDMDRSGTYCNNNKSLNEVEELIDQYYLKDVWRIQNPYKREYSWFKSGDIKKASRIDYALV